MTSDSPMPTYAESGVDEVTEQSIFRKVMLPWLRDTTTTDRSVNRIDGLDSGFFATLVHLNEGPTLALTTDGVGTKLVIGRMLSNYESAGIDCVANNVNDLLCVGATPLVLLDYIATDRVDEVAFEQIAKGLHRGANEAQIAIPGGEIAQVGDMLTRDAGQAPALDLVGSAMGIIAPSASGNATAIDGAAVRAGDVVLGLPSSGLHSNGFSLVRHALFNVTKSSMDERLEENGRSLAEELLLPTRIYVKAIKSLQSRGIHPHGLVNISGGGLLNLGRLAANVSYVLDAVPIPPAIFEIIKDRGRVSTATMYATFNMGVGFCVVLHPTEIDAAIRVLEELGESPLPLGRVTSEAGKRIHVPELGLIGHEDEFRAES